MKMNCENYKLNDKFIYLGEVCTNETPIKNIYFMDEKQIYKYLNYFLLISCI